PNPHIQMKRILKWLGILLGVVLVVVLAGAAYIHFAPMPSSPVNAPDLTVTADSAQIAEGRRLATLVCHQCHMSDNGKLEGNLMADMPPELGKAWGPNITQSPASRLAGYTDGELAYLLRTGIKRDGRYAPPWMPKFPHLSDYDLESVIAYLRADFPELQPSD